MAAEPAWSVGTRTLDHDPRRVPLSCERSESPCGEPTDPHPEAMDWLRWPTT